MGMGLITRGAWLLELVRLGFAALFLLTTGVVMFGFGLRTPVDWTLIGCGAGALLIGILAGRSALRAARRLRAMQRT